MTKTILLIALIAALAFVSCGTPSIKGSGNVTTEERTIDYVSKVDITGNFSVEINCGETNTLKIEAEDNILPLIETKVEDEKITIRELEKLTNLREIKIILSIHTLVELETNGKSNIIAKNINSDELDVSMDGEGEIQLEGKVDDLNISMDGEGKILAKDLQSKNAYVIVYGDGKSEIYARKSLKAKVKGEGVIDYYGDPEDLAIDVAKGGAVNKK
ncbi:MAG: DUF2807 domain-containing protein [Ignavibacteriae bacterium]|nr:DUF2807 domain-containing protein [Ignavibacteriota bacterium]